MRSQRTSAMAVAGVALMLLLACAPGATPTPVPATATPTRAAAATATPQAPPAGGSATPRPTSTSPPTAVAAAAPRQGGTLRYAALRDPPTWNPFGETVNPLTEIKTLVFSNLFTWWSDPPQNCQRGNYPLAVKAWRWADDTTVELVLKEGMRYHNKPPVNGREAVAADFAAVFPLYQKGIGYMAGASAHVQGVTALDKYTVRVKLDLPWGGFVGELLAHMYSPWLAPPEAGGPDGKLWETPEKSLIGSGPFMFERRRPDVDVSFVRNPDYWLKPLPYFDRVEFAMIPDVSTQAAAFRSGRLDMIVDLAANLRDDVQRAVPNLQIARCPGTQLTGAGVLFMPIGAPPYDDVRVRRAVSMAIDRQFIIETFYRGQASYPGAMGSGMPYGLNKLEDYPPDIRQFLEYRPDQAKKLLAEAGYPNGLDTVLNFTTRYPQPHPMISEAIASMLAKVGIRAKLNLMESGRYVAVVIGNTFPDGEMVLNPLTVTTPEDALAFTSLWSKAGRTNRSRVKDPEYDKLYEQFLRTTGEEDRAKVARQMQLMAADRAWRVPLPMSDSTVTAHGGLHFTWPGNTRNLGMMLATAWRE